MNKFAFDVKVTPPDSPTRRDENPNSCDLKISTDGRCYMVSFLANKSERQAVIQALKDFDSKPTKRRAGK